MGFIENLVGVRCSMVRVLKGRALCEKLSFVFPF